MYKRGGLCLSCNQARLAERYRERQSKKSKPLFSDKAKKQIAEDDATYWEVYEASPHICQECGKPLPTDLPKKEILKDHRYMFSHILPKSTHPHLRNVVENFNLLCLKCHNKWENRVTQKSMRIWEKNKPIIVKLLKQNL